MNLELIKKQPEAPNIISFWFKKPNAIRYNAGEYIEVSLDLEQADNRGYRRWFTLSSSPTEDRLSITTKFPPAELLHSSFKQHLAQLKIGQKVQISPPMGDFVLPHDLSQPIVFVSVGMGITPFRSMLKYIYDKKLDCNIHLVQAVRWKDELIFTDLFSKISGLELTQIVAEPNNSWKGETGRLDVARIEKLVDGFGKKLIYFAGPEQIVEVFDAELITRGHPRHLVKTDYFPGYTKG